jgi:phosphoketolase
MSPVSTAGGRRAAGAQGGAMTEPLPSEQLRKMDAYWRAANYLAVGQIYLYDNPLLREPLTLDHIKPGSWDIGERRPG